MFIGKLFGDMKSTRRPVVMSRCSSRSLASLLAQRLHALLHLKGPKGLRLYQKPMNFNIICLYIYTIFDNVYIYTCIYCIIYIYIIMMCNMFPDLREYHVDYVKCR